MKKLFLLLLPVILLISCGTTRYCSKIQGRTVSQQGYFAPMSDDLSRLIDQGLVVATPVPGGTYLVKDSIYIISPTWNQAWKNAKAKGELWPFFGGATISVGTIGSYAAITSAGIGDLYMVSLPMAGVIVGGPIMGASLEWDRWNMDQAITKSQFVSLHGDMAAFWNTIPIK